MTVAGWTTRADVLGKLRRRWDSGELLGAFVTGQPAVPLEIPLRAPRSREIAANLAAVQDWAQRWREDDGAGLRVEYAPVGGRLVGVNDLPCRVRVEEWQSLWSLLGVASVVRRFSALIDETQLVAPALVEWMVTRPHEVLAVADEWHTLVATVLWIDAHAGPGTYLRQIDAPGADTKFVERHRAVLARLLDRQLPAERIDFDCPAANFAGRYHFRRKPQYIRFRWLDPGRDTAGFSELTVPAAELAAMPLNARTILVVENDTTYLALPELADTVALFGGGYAVTRLGSLSWLADRRLCYWGDIDTHGFAILDRLRGSFPHTESVLMDRTTLLAHEQHWVRENSPAVAMLDGLRPAEAELYRDLVEDTFGPAVRLEQERIRFSIVESALARL
ncbi:MAG: hypothetical protein J2P18_03675 [Nocardia sp.]|nr:hypothetical protein [Nocardia sp.]